MVARLLHLVVAETHEKTLEILNMFREKFLEGKMKRMKITIPALIFALIRLIREIHLEHVDTAA